MGCCNAIGTEHGKYGLSCIQKLWSAQAVLSLYGMLESKLCCEILLLLNVADILYMHVEGCVVSSVSALLIYLLSVNRLRCMLRVLWCA